LTEKEAKKRPHGGGEMLKDRRLISYTEISLAKENQYVGDNIDVFTARSVAT
jgi:hypothetical protein